jgi:hypothetical protein
MQPFQARAPHGHSDLHKVGGPRIALTSLPDAATLSQGARAIVGTS